MEIVLYSNGCPRCNVLKKKLDSKGIIYKENNSVEEMLALGLTQVPALLVDKSMLWFAEANEWVNNQ